MRKKTTVPIGQGCTPYTKKDTEKTNCVVGMCQRHFWLYLNHCLGCGEKFHTEKPYTKTCSDKCRKRLSRMRHEVLFQTVMKFAEGVQ